MWIGEPHLVPRRRRRRRQPLLVPRPTAATCAATPTTTSYYARHAQSDGKRIVYQCGARPVAVRSGAATRRASSTIETPAHRTQAARRFVAARPSTSSRFKPHPGGPQRSRSIARGKLFAMRALGRRASRQHDARDAPTRAARHARLRRGQWLADGSDDGRGRATRRARSASSSSRGDGARTLPWDIGHVSALRRRAGRHARRVRQPSQRGLDRRRRRAARSPPSTAASTAAATTSPGRPTAPGSPTRSGRRHAPRAIKLYEVAATARRRCAHRARVPRLLRRRSIPTGATSTSCRCAPSIRSTTASSFELSFPRARAALPDRAAGRRRAAVRSGAARA